MGGGYRDHILKAGATRRSTHFAQSERMKFAQRQPGMLLPSHCSLILHLCLLLVGQYLLHAPIGRPMSPVQHSYIYMRSHDKVFQIRLCIKHHRYRKHCAIVMHTNHTSQCIYLSAPHSQDQRHAFYGGLDSARARTDTDAYYWN